MKQLIAVILLVQPYSSWAQLKTFEREYTYKASEIDSKSSCRAIAIEQLRSILLNELGVYVQSESLLTSADINGQFKQDFVENIATISAGIVKFNVLQETWNGELFWMKATVTVDEKSLAESIKEITKDRQKTKELFEIREQLKKTNKELEELRSQLVESTSDDKKAVESINKRYRGLVGSINAKDYYFIAEESFGRSDYIKAIEYYEKAIMIDSGFAMAYVGKGLALVGLHQYGKAIEQYDRAMKLNPTFAGTYYFRGLAQVGMKDYLGAIKDYSMAIEIDPKFAGGYVSIGHAKRDLKDDEGAIEAYTMAIDLDPKIVDAYWGRAAIKGNQKLFAAAMRDCNRAIEIDPKCAGALLTRGHIKLKQKDSMGAIVDFDKTISLEPENSDAYYLRGLAKMMIGKRTEGCMDLSKAGELGISEAYELIAKYCN